MHMFKQLNFDWKAAEGTTISVVVPNEPSPIAPKRAPTIAVDALSY